MATLSSASQIRRIFPTARQLLLEADVNDFFPEQARKILVIGAGLDPYRTRFGNAELYVGIDVVCHPGVTDVVADAQNLPFSDGTFDCVVATEVAEHVREPLRLIHEAHRVLVPEGLLLLSVPFGFHQHADPADYWRPTRWLLKEAVTRFQTAQILAQGNRLHVLSDLITTAFFPCRLFVPLRVFNHLLVRRKRSRKQNATTFPSGHFVVAIK